MLPTVLLKMPNAIHPQVDDRRSRVNPVNGDARFFYPSTIELHMLHSLISSLVLLADELPAEVPVTESATSGNLVLLLTVFALAVLIGFEVITKIPPALHTPLMSGSNAISGITLVGAILAAGADHGTAASVLGFLAVVLATMNVVGGFVVTNRMLAMFRTRKRDSNVE